MPIAVCRRCEKDPYETLKMSWPFNDDDNYLQATFLNITMRS